METREMTIEELKLEYVQNLKILKNINNLITNQTGEVTDGYHSFNELYYHRNILFTIILQQNKSISWRSKLHEDGTMFENYFIAGINTNKGQYTYHFSLDFWYNFDGIKTLDNAPKWDGHKPSDILRLLSLFSNSKS